MSALTHLGENYPQTSSSNHSPLSVYSSSDVNDRIRLNQDDSDIEDGEDEYRTDLQDDITDRTTPMSSPGQQLSSPEAGASSPLHTREFDVCSICQSVFDQGKHMISTLPCGHMYGFPCITKWLNQKGVAGKCPQCKRDFRAENVIKLYGTRVSVSDDVLHTYVWSLEGRVGKLETEVCQQAEAISSLKDKMVETLKSPEEMLTILLRILEEIAPVLVTARLDAEERRNNIRLREEQEAAHQAALEAAQARERQRKEEEERLEIEAAEAEKKQKGEAAAREREAREAAEREAKLIKLREEKSLSLGPEPEKGPDVTQVLVRLPNGERKGRRFHSTATIQSLYNFVDSSGSLEPESYTLVTNFPRVLYGQDKLSMTLKQVGLHPQASLFVEISHYVSRV